MKATSHLFSALMLDPHSRVPLHRQLYSELRESVLTGRLAAGARLPSTRDLARDLRVSRNTVIEAFEQLIAEGYFEGHTGIGTFVAGNLADTRPRRTVVPLQPAAIRAADSPVPLAGDSRFPLCPGVPAIEEFPITIWARLAGRTANRASRTLLNYGDPLGHLALRQAIAGYLGASRGVRCTAEQVVIVTGAQQGLDLVARVLAGSGGPVWMEDPVYPLARLAIESAGATVTPIPVDREGLDLDHGIRTGTVPRLIYITPSHQYPLGMTMTLARRLQLLEWAIARDAYILEDDYDGEFRFSGRSVPALQGLDDSGRVLYLGTFSKVLFPGLRIGYLVVPPSLLPAVARLKAVTDFGSGSLSQATLAEFFQEGHFTRHLRRMRVLYRERQDALLHAARVHLPGLLDIEPSEVGLHVVGWLPYGADDNAVARRLHAGGLGCSALSVYCIAQKLRPALVVGYGNLNPSDAPAICGRLSELLASGRMDGAEHAPVAREPALRAAQAVARDGSGA